MRSLCIQILLRRFILFYILEFYQVILQKFSVLFSDQIKYIVDKHDNVIEGNMENHETIRDKWVFERDISSSNPNWKLVETDIFED